MFTEILRKFFMFPFLLVNWFMNPGGEVCYPETGCFSNKPPFDHMPLPMNPNDIMPKYFLFRNGTSPKLVDNPKLVNVNELTILIHGFGGSYENTKVWNQGIIQNLLTRKSYGDVLFVEWVKGAALGSSPSNLYHQANYTKKKPNLKFKLELVYRLHQMSG